MKPFLLTISLIIIVFGGFWLLEADILSDLITSLIIAFAIGISFSYLIDHKNTKQ